MSFQHFRLGELSLHQPLPPHLTQHQQPQPHPPQPYGSGDTDDGYTLVFSNLQAFQEWRASEEERQMVEFVKGDTHGSKAIPPRFKDHTKLVCARHSRSGRKKYVKKHPERVRKVPSRKLEGVGCPASISYKTYFDTEEVRACYISQHSHEIGLANLPFTRRGRKAAVQQEKERRKSVPIEVNAAPVPPPPAPSNVPNTNAPTSISAPAPQPTPSYAPTSSILPAVTQNQQSQSAYQPTTSQQNYTYSAPPPAPGPPPPQTYAPQTPHGFPQERWDNMATLFSSIRENARAFEYPLPSVSALETVLLRLYLETPVGVGVPTHMGGHMNGMSRQANAGQGQGGQQSGAAGGLGNGNGGEDNS
ncbi:hypothetical protein BDQ17DRAFT_1341330 [Cyathus striatus]|nr:hypothetical protein BDQ17DRAFT_1341330 [Cyathus striatus]